MQYGKTIFSTTFVSTVIVFFSLNKTEFDAVKKLFVDANADALNFFVDVHITAHTVRKEPLI